MPRPERRLLRAAFDQPSCNHGPPQAVNERRKRPDVIRQFLGHIAQGLELGLGGRIGNHQAGDFAISIPQADRRLIRPDRLVNAPCGIISCSSRG